MFLLAVGKKYTISIFLLERKGMLFSLNSTFFQSIATADSP